MGKVRNRIWVTVRKHSVGGKFQAELEPTEELEADEIAARWSEKSGLRPNLTRLALASLSEYILDELSEGRKLNFDLVSFYPRLSGALPSRDADPEVEDIYVRGAVKARRKLMEGIRKNLDPINRLSVSRPRVFNVLDRDVSRFDVIAAGHVLSVSGREIDINPSREDEGIWLEKRTGRGFVRVARARIQESAPDHALIVFDDAIERRLYSISVYTRCGRSTDFKLLRCRHEVRAL